VVAALKAFQTIGNMPIEILHVLQCTFGIGRAEHPHARSAVAELVRDLHGRTNAGNGIKENLITKENGGDYRIRTDDIRLAKATLYQLS
jgi:hypothetical protein